MATEEEEEEADSNMYGSIRRMDDEDSEAETDGHQIESNHQEDRSKNEESKNPELS